MVLPKIGFVRRVRLRLSIVSRHSANAELQNEKCKMKSANTKNVKCQQKTPKAERILTFALCNFSAKGGSPSGGHFTMLYSPNRRRRVGEYKTLGEILQMSKGYVRKDDERNPNKRPIRNRNR